MAQGMAQGKLQGAHDNAIASARAMKADGMPTALITKYTGLNEEQIAKI